MELYLDSVNFKEIEAASDLGFLTGLTTTPTFMHREGITDIDAAIKRLAKKVPILQIEALGNNAEAIMDETYRLLDLGLDKTKTVFKIPISLEGAKACRKLRDKGLLVNLHLIYTLQQAYIAMAAGANYICPLVGRLQDQGHDALSMVEQCVNATIRYGYASKIMFSSVRNSEHVRNAINIGVHACTMPWTIMKQLTQNDFTDTGKQQFEKHTYLLTTRVHEVMQTADTMLSFDATVFDALIQMTKSKLGAVIVLDAKGSIYRIFTDGDLRRYLRDNKNIGQMKLSELESNAPFTIDAGATLYEASAKFVETKVDNIIVVEDQKPVGLIDVQDIL
ncbi:MAG TPA: transaldolase family protein [Cyclobacteriaceae bacterium]|nr:transaldolase family protein [Cyclobacteriaceae bacterium]